MFTTLRGDRLGPGSLQVFGAGRFQVPAVKPEHAWLSCPPDIGSGTKPETRKAGKSNWGFPAVAQPACPGTGRL